MTEIDSRGVRCEHHPVKSCPSCRADVPPQVAVCPFCGARFPDAPPRRTGLDSTPAEDAPDEERAATDAASTSAPASKPPAAPGLDLPAAPMVLMGGAPAREAQRSGGGRALPLLLVLAALVAAVVWFVQRPPLFPAAGLSPVLATGGVICGDADECVVVYLAPWDDASQRTAQMFAELRRVWAEDGPQLEALVGAGETAAMQRMARAAGGSSWIDADDAVMDALEVETVPTWFRVSGGRIVARVDGTWLPLDRQLRALGLAPRGLDTEDESVATGEDERRVLTGEGTRRVDVPEDDASDDDAVDPPAEDEAAEDEAAEDEPADEPADE